ncbi:MAG: PLP-dependent aminotransferase family protein, partial [Deltaproteobacteria bacterium]|nr:PLP-dependent aminotransferase family protein [Deltaproteobacteria bacterium]
PPGMIHLGIGQPDPSLLPLALMKNAAEHRLSHDDVSLLAYGAESGDGYFRLALARFLAEHYHKPVDADDLFVTAGASQGLDLICTLFTKPGETIFVEEPSYFLALNIFRDHGLNIIGLPMDEDGLMVEALEENLTQHNPAFLYTIPTFHNPSSITLSAARRERLVQLSQEHNLLIVADEVYHLLAYDTSPPQPLANYTDTGMIFSIGSFSKILAPGLRLGWIQANQALLHRLVKSGLLESGGGLNPFTSKLVQSALELGLQLDHLSNLKTVYGHRMVFLSAALRRHLGSFASFSKPNGGFFIWLRLPEQIDAEALLSEARQHNVGFQPGIKFSSRQSLKNYVRLCFSFYDTPELEAAAGRLADVLRNHR